ncbi:unnamed protein product, partial [Tetraodon nigroviridis]
LGNASPHLLNDFPDPKGLLNNALSRSLGVGDLSQYIQYSCTEHAGVKKATVKVLWPSRFEAEGHASKKIDAERQAAAAACLRLKASCSLFTLYCLNLFAACPCFIKECFSVCRKWESLAQIISYPGGELAEDAWDHNLCSLIRRMICGQQMPT